MRGLGFNILKHPVPTKVDQPIHYQCHYRQYTTEKCKQEYCFHSQGHVITSFHEPESCGQQKGTARKSQIKNHFISDGTACNIIILKQGHLVEWGHLLEKGQLLIKTHSKKELIQKGARIGRRALINQIITVLSIKTITQHTV